LNEHLFFFVFFFAGAQLAPPVAGDTGWSAGDAIGLVDLGVSDPSLIRITTISSAPATIPNISNVL
jgi:hypothetical protein